MIFNEMYETWLAFLFRGIFASARTLLTDILFTPFVLLDLYVMVYYILFSRVCWNTSIFIASCWLSWWFFSTCQLFSSKGDVRAHHNLLLFRLSERRIYPAGLYQHWMNHLSWPALYYKYCTTPTRLQSSHRFYHILMEPSIIQPRHKCLTSTLASLPPYLTAVCTCTTCRKVTA